MALCLNGIAPVINWEYAGGEVARIIKADDYKVGMEPSYPRDTNYRFVYRSASLNNGVVTWGNDFVRFNSDKFNGIQSWRLKVKHKGVSFYPADNKFFTYVYVAATGKYNAAPIGDRLADFYVEVVSQGVTTTIYLGSDDGLWGQKFIPIDNIQDPQICAFKVYSKEVVVLQRATSVCPVVTVTCGEECPPGTCQCDCGSEVCCYDTTTGKAVKSFKK